MSEFDQYINTILSDIKNDNIKNDLKDEIKDHLVLLKNDYLKKGYQEQDALKLAMFDFGESYKIRKEVTNTLLPFKKIFSVIAWVLFASYISILSYNYINMFLFRAFAYSDLSYNLIPFKTIIEYLNVYGIDTTIQNMVAFIPLGLFLPVLFNVKKINHILITAFLIPLIIESIQLITASGVFDIDDILLESIGIIVGFTLINVILTVANKFKFNSKTFLLNQ